jgi:hypothetical protein
MKTEQPLSYRAASADMAIFNARARLDRNPTDAASLAIVADVELAYLIMDRDDAYAARLAAMPAWRRSME